MLHSDWRNDSWTIAASAPLLTRWAVKVSPRSAHREHPRPDAWRSGRSWKSLNGLWDADSHARNLSEPPFSPAPLPQRILVPFPFESSLGGLRVQPKHGYMWYRRHFSIPRAVALLRRRVLLKFEAVDWLTDVYVSRQFVGQHLGGYDGFSFDITNFSKWNSSLELVVGVRDTTEKCDKRKGRNSPAACFRNLPQPSGKQSSVALPDMERNRVGPASTYTSTSGIWGTVWLEYVPMRYVADVHVTTELVGEPADFAVAVVSFSVIAGGGEVSGCHVHAALFQQADGAAVASAQVPAASSSSLQLRVSAAKLWSPADPFLYNATVRLVGNCGDAGAVVDDTMNTYVGIRSVQLQTRQVRAAQGCAHQSVHNGPMETVTTAERHGACQKQCVPPRCAGWTWSSRNNSCVLHALLLPPIAHKAHSWCGSWATKLQLNGKPIFMAGVLSQGFWPDGVYTVPTEEADIYELTSHREMGFNMVRKHLMVAPHRWYYHTDRLGLLVWQDMPERIHGSGGLNFVEELEAMVQGRRNHPSIIQWSIYNEVNGHPLNIKMLARQHVRSSYNLVRKLDPTRPINTVSGSMDRWGSTQRAFWGVTDVQDFHSHAFGGVGPINTSLLVTVSEAHRAACRPPTQHMWFHERQSRGQHPCYGAVDDTTVHKMAKSCEEAAASYVHWAAKEVSSIQYFGLSMVGYVQNRDMEGECNGLLTFDGEPKLNVKQIQRGNALLFAAHDRLWRDSIDQATHQDFSKQRGRFHH